LNAGLVFKSDNTVSASGDWARLDYKGLCQVCHHGTGAGTASQAKYYTQSADNTSHNSTTACMSCHSHDNDMGASCTGCHGDGLNRSWPQKPGPGPAVKTLTTDYNYNGEHLLHLTELATRIGGYNADNAQWSSAQQQTLCSYCHDYSADVTHGTVSGRAKLFPATGKKMMGGGVDNGTPAFVAADNSCTGVQCHNRKGTTATYNWYTGQPKQCAMCHTPGGAFDNNPRSGLHAPASANVTKHDNTLMPTSGLTGCQSCHWNTGWPAQSTTQTHINGSNPPTDNAALTLNRANMTFTDSPTVNRGSCQGSGLDNVVGCHSDRGAWKRLWSTEADNTATAVGSPRCNVCHGQWSTIAGSAGWRDNTSHFVASNLATDVRGKMHDAAPEDCDQCHVYATGQLRHDNAAVTRQIHMNSTGTTYARSGTRAGCAACHEGATGVANAHDLRTSVFPSVTVAGTTPTGSCYGCHGDGSKRYWPQNAGNSRVNAAMSDYNNDGKHTAHITDLAARIGGYAADNATWTDNQQKTLCLYCHDYVADTNHMTVGVSYNAQVFNGAGKKSFWGAAETNATFDCTVYTCANLDCHNNKTTTATYNWYTASTSSCIMCHTPVQDGTGVLDNNPHSGLHYVSAAAQTAGVKAHDNNLGANGCTECHVLPAHSTTSKHINGTNDCSAVIAATIVRTNLTFTDCTANNKRGSCQGVGLSVAAGCHSDGGAWKRLWSSEADNTATVVGSPRCNVCHGQWKSLAGSAGWRDNTTHFKVSGSDNDSRGKGHDGAPESCDACHVYATGAARHDNTSSRQINMNSTGSTFAVSGTRAGCAACHEGATGTANSHDFPLSVFPLGSIAGSAIPMPACDSCHDKSAAGTAPKVFDKAGGYTIGTGNGQRTTAYGSHLTQITGGALSAATNWDTQCKLCHAGHSGTPVTIPLPDNNYTDNNSGVGLNMQAILGINYTANGGIHLGGTATVGTTEARICWNCHWSDPTISGHKAEFGVNSNTNTGSRVYDYGSLSTATTDNNGWYAANGTTPATWNAVSTTPSFAYKAAPLQSMHSTAMSAGKPKAAGPGNKTLADIRCSYCHDVHDLNKATRTTVDANNSGIYADNVTGPPYLRGTWRGNPFKEDGAPTGTTLAAYASTYAPYRNVPRGSTAQTEMGGYWINQNTSGADTTALAGSAGLCVLCHNSDVNNMNIFGAPSASWVGTGNGHANSAIGGTGTASGKQSNIFNLRGGTAGNTTNPAMHFTGASDPGNGSPYGFRGNSDSSAKFPPTATPRAYGTNTWAATIDAATVNNKYHQFLCSKCHNPHASRLPRLMITNCLDVKHNAWQTAAVGLPTSAQFGTLNKSRRIASWTSAQNCHRLTQWSDNATTGAGWNKVTPW
ncbi:MAG TPA: hypothetical protein VGP72_08995, partial [Planctomycetota bacterium]